MNDNKNLDESDLQSISEIELINRITKSFKTKNDEKPFMRGINSMQLMNDGVRWWIINIYWMQESKDNPIPERYLPKQ